VFLNADGRLTETGQISHCRQAVPDGGSGDWEGPPLTTTESQTTFAGVIMPPALGGHFGIARSIHLSVPWCSCLGYRHAGCLQLSYRRQPEMCGLQTRPWTDVDPLRLFGLNCHQQGHIILPQ